MFAPPAQIFATNFKGLFRDSRRMSKDLFFPLGNPKQQIKREDENVSLSSFLLVVPKNDFEQNNLGHSSEPLGVFLTRGSLIIEKR